MGTEINNDEEKESEKINEDDIIENDCYEEIDMRKINQIIEKEKNWNNNTIIYRNNNIINISNLDIETEKEQNQKQNEENNNIIIEQNEKEENDKDNSNNNNNNNNTTNNNNNNNSNKESLKNNNTRPAKKMLHVMPKIRPKNTSDEALNPELFDNKEKKKELNIIPESNNQKFVKNTENIEQSNEINIKSIIPQIKLNRLKEDEIIFSGTLEKILNVPESKKLVYTSRFCVLTKKYFAYYKSKESFISLNKPMFVIENSDIIRTENTFLDGEGYFGIVCDVNERTKNLVYRVNSFVTKEENNSQLLLGFRSNKYEEMTKWLILLNYFISEKSNND